MNNYPIVVIYSDEDQGYIANIPDLKYCSAFGHTPEEAVREVQIAQRAWLASAEAHGKPIPQPGTHANQELTELQQSGNIHVVPAKGQWIARRQTQQVIGVYTTQEEAIEAATKVAENGKVIVHNRSGRIREHIKTAQG